MDAGRSFDMAQEHDEPQSQGHSAAIDPPGKTKLPPKDAVIEALMELAGERVWDDITISDIAARANLSLADFRDLYPSKGAILGGFARKIDRTVLEGTSNDLLGERTSLRCLDAPPRRFGAV
jgi:AcrR family transcriptional regulator